MRMTPLSLRENMNGIEWMVDAHGCAPEALRNPELLRKLFEQIISALRLRQVGEAQWHQFPNSGGITGLCLLAESHLACHTFPEFGSLCLNLFCCVPRERWDFEAELTAAFSASSVSVRTVTRHYSQHDELRFEPFRSQPDIPQENPSR